MPEEKKPKHNSSKSSSKKLDLLNVKKELVEDLEQFLMDEQDINNAQIRAEKNSALSELDKLIAQDLSYNQILSTLKRKAQESIETKSEEPRKVSNAIPSSHVLDLRQDVPKAETKKARPHFTLHKEKEEKENAVVKEQPAVEISHKKEKPKKEKRPPRSYNLSLNHAFSKVIVFGLVLAIVLLPIRGLIFFGQIQQDGRQILNFGQEGFLKLQKGVTNASEDSFENAEKDFGLALQEFRNAQSVLNDYEAWVLNAASIIPGVGSPISLGRNLIEVAANISEAATILGNRMKGDEPITVKIEFLEEQIDKTLPFLESATNDILNINEKFLPADLRPYFASLKNYLPKTTANLKNLDEVFDVLQEILGHEKEKRYLVLFQNNNELRATGGFIGSYALFDIYQGEVVDLEVPSGGTYDLDAGQTTKYKAPRALSLVNQYFNIWDANWWSDFPTSAEKIATMFNNAGGSSVDGVIAINSDVLVELLDVLGGVDMPDYGITVTAENLYAVLQEEIEVTSYERVEDGEENTEPKAVIKDLVPLVLEKLLDENSNKAALAETLSKVLSNKDIQIYSTNVELQNKIKRFGWAGDLKNTSGDFLQVVTTNIGGGKTDNDIFQVIDHQAEITKDGEIINTVKLTRTNRAVDPNPFAGIDGGNVSYMRFYVPEGSQFIQALGFDKLPDSYFRAAVPNAKVDEDLAKEEDRLIDGGSQTEIYNSLGKTVFANWMQLGPGESKTISIKYKLPFKLNVSDPLVNDWLQDLFKKNTQLDNYSLVLQSQSGVNPTIFNSSILLPENLKVVWTNSTHLDKLSVTDLLVSYSTELTSDEYFGFILTTD